MLRGKKILIGVTGSIAAYKTASLVRLLIKAGVEVKVIMTSSSKDFVAPLTLSTLAKHPVLSEISENDSWSDHVMLGRWADVMIIAPLSCNTLSKMANGVRDNLLMAVYLSSVCPVIVAPAMDEDMWKHPSTKANILKIESYKNFVIPVEKGELASGLEGEGRMAEPEHIISYLETYFSKSKEFSGKRVLISAGPTYEAIDAVRFIGNHSSGKMGIAIAEGFKARGAEVTLICGPTAEQIDPELKCINAISAAEMFHHCMELYLKMDVIVMAAAVADYTVVNPSKDKIKKNGNSLVLELEKTADILQALGDNKKAGQILVGFALETNNERENALKKLHAKKADMIVLNSLNDEGAGFGHDSNKIIIFDKKGNEYGFGIKSKKEIASDIINTIIKFSDEKN